MSAEGQILEHKRQAERLFCACLFVQPDLIRHNCGWLNPEDFTEPQYKKYWGLVRSGVNAAEAAIDAGIYTDMVMEQTNIVSTLDYAAFAKGITEDNYFLHILKNVSKVAQMAVNRDKEDIFKLLNGLIEEQPVNDDIVYSAVDIALEFADMIGKESLTIKTGLPKYDEALGGLDLKALHLIAARPSMGKTTLALQIARNMAAAGNKVIFFSLETSRVRLWAKMATTLAGVPWKKVKNNELTEEEHTHLLGKSADLMNVYEDRLRIYDGTRLNSEGIWKIAAKYKPNAIIVDHLSLTTDQGENENRRLGQVTWVGKQIARDFNLAAIYLQQLSRDVAKRKDKEPDLTDLRDSGETEQNADTVTFIHRDDYYSDPRKKTPEWSKTALFIKKNRDGYRNEVAYTWFSMARQWFYTQEQMDKIKLGIED